MLFFLQQGLARDSRRFSKDAIVTWLIPNYASLASGCHEPRTIDQLHFEAWSRGLGGHPGHMSGVQISGRIGSVPVVHLSYQLLVRRLYSTHPGNQDFATGVWGVTWAMLVYINSYSTFFVNRSLGCGSISKRRLCKDVVGSSHPMRRLHFGQRPFQIRLSGILKGGPAHALWTLSLYGRPVARGAGVLDPPPPRQSVVLG